MSIINSFKAASIAVVTEPLSIALGEEIDNLIATLQVGFDVLQRRLNKLKDTNRK